MVLHLGLIHTSNRATWDSSLKVGAEKDWRSRVFRTKREWNNDAPASHGGESGSVPRLRLAVKRVVRHQTLPAVSRLQAAHLAPSSVTPKAQAR